MASEESCEADLQRVRHSSPSSTVLDASDRDVGHSVIATGGDQTSLPGLIDASSFTLYLETVASLADESTTADSTSTPSEVAVESRAPWSCCQWHHRASLIWSSAIICILLLIAVVTRTALALFSTGGRQ